jgi:hypothetical protein
VNYLTSLLSNCYHFSGTIDSIYNPEGLKDGVIKVPAEILPQLKQLSG